MIWIEVPVDVECPHCGEESTEHCEFNTLEGDNCGISGPWRDAECWTCAKSFWIKPYLGFDTDADVYKKKPKGAM